MEKKDAHLKAGKLGEKLAVDYLKNKGYRIVETNYRCGLGEIDIVATEKKTLVFVEVKARKADRFGSPQAAVTAIKQRKLSLLAQWYLQEKKLGTCPARFDVVAIRLNSDKPAIELIRNAFELC